MTATFRMKWGKHGIGKDTARKHTQRNGLRDITQKATNIARILPKNIENELREFECTYRKDTTCI